jgi:hypothetical protein
VSTTQYWVGTTLVVDWAVTDVDGAAVDDATVTGVVRLPDDTTDPWTATWVSADGVYRASYTPDIPGRHVWQLEAFGTATGAVEGAIVVQRSLLGLPPITVDPTTDVGRVRLLATDLDEVVPLFDDAQIEAFLALGSSRVKRAAALALETIAVSEALISKKIKTLDLTTDGPAVARELRERARALRAEDDTDDDGPWGLDIVNYDPWAAYRRTAV